MSSSSLCASLFALIAYAAIVSAAPAAPVAPSLTVKTSASSISVDGFGDFKVTVTIVNTCGETLRLLNDPRGVLDPFPENSFTVTGPYGSSPSFNGATANYSLTDAIGLDDPSVFTVLAPGASVVVTHDLSAAYDFTRSGAGDYSIEPSNLFTYVDTDGTPKDLHATVEDIVKVKLSGDLAVPRRVHNKRDFYGCSTEEQKILDIAIRVAEPQVEATLTYLKRMRGSTERYETWFGKYDEGRKDAVRTVFQRISDNTAFAALTYDCTCPKPKKPTTVAYVSYEPEDHEKVFICPPFWTYPVPNHEAYSGVLIHEVSHYIYNGLSKDDAYGEAACMDLAKKSPWDAVKNADNLRFFAVNNPPLR